MMKHHILSLALMSALLLVGCAKTSDIENLQEQIDTLKSDQIESIESQIESIKKSITSLEGTDTALREYIDALQEQITSLKNREEENSEEIEELQKAVETLQEKDKDLQEQINALKEYVDTLVSDTEKWANATFATIEQYNTASKTIADIQAQIEAINSKLTSTEETLAAYKTIIDSINDTIASMKLDIEAIQKQVKDLLARIQSISYVPQYSDGRAVMTYYTDAVAVAGDIASFDFELKPASAAKEIATLWTANPEILTMKAVYTITKTPSVEELDIESVTAEDGYLTVTVSGRGLKDEFFRGQCSASVRLSISDGNNDMTTEYIPMVPEMTDMNVIIFADANFRTYCVNNFDTDGDGMISEKEAKAVTRIECSLAGLASLDGIEYFSNLEYLDVRANGLTSLEVSHNPKLKVLLINNNKLTSLDVSQNVLLVTLDCSDNALTSLDVSRNAALTTLALAYNTALETLDASSTALSDIDLSKNVAIKSLSLNNCSAMSIIDLSANTALETLSLSSTPLTTLDVSNNTSLTTLDVSTTVKLVVSKGLKSSIYQVGQYVSIDGVTGIVYQTSSPYIVSTNQTSAAWSAAMTWCTNKGSAWYLPAKSELSTIYNNKSTLNKTLSAIGGTQLGKSYYWSSTEDNSNYAYDVDFYDGDVVSYNKGYSFCVRAVRAL